MSRPPETPARFERPTPLAFALTVGIVALLIVSIQGAELSLSRLISGLPRLGGLLGDMFPPDIDRLWPIIQRLYETLQMALVGTAIGTLLSVPLAIWATEKHSPHPIVRTITRGLISLFRTVPDLVWALVFVIAVGLGPFAGTLALIVDTMGFSARFFAESMEETDAGPQEALTALGATPNGIVFSAVIPAALPSMINTSLYALELAVRSSVVLGLVGAGGIGIELKVAFDMFQYDQAATIILCIFVLVLAVERLSSYARRRII